MLPFKPKRDAMSKIALLGLTLAASILGSMLVAVPGQAQDTRCAVTCNGTDNACYRACTGR